MLDVLTTQEVARELGVTADRVRRLVRAQRLPARRAGGQLLIPRDAVERLRAAAPPGGRRGGRPWSPTLAWAAMLCLDDDHRGLARLARQQRYRLTHRLAAAADLAAIAPRLAARARVHRLTGHPSVLAEIRSTGLLTGLAAVGEYGVGLPSDPVAADIYTPTGSVRAMVEDLVLRPEGGNVVLRAVPDPAWPGIMSGVAPRAAVALDLLEQPDARSRQAARRLAAQIGRSWPR